MFIMMIQIIGILYFALFCIGVVGGFIVRVKEIMLEQGEKIVREDKTEYYH